MHQSSWIKGFYGNSMGSATTGRGSQFKARLSQAICGITIAVAGLTVGTVAASLVVAPAVHAYTTEDLISVSWETGEDYNALVRRAEDAARASAQQQFDSDILLTRVIVTVLGENGGETVPILRLDVAREDWRRRPDPQFWATYFRTSRALLDLNQPASATRTTQSAPARSPAPTPTSPPNAAPDTPASPNQPRANAALGPTGSHSINPVPISIPATPAGQTGLPRSILR